MHGKEKGEEAGCVKVSGIKKAPAIVGAFF
jgi:hypothetical protein